MSEISDDVQITKSKPLRELIERSLTYSIEQEDLQILISFLHMQFQTSRATFHVYKSTIIRCLNSIAKSLSKINDLMMFNYLTNLDKRKCISGKNKGQFLSIHSRKSKRSYLIQFFSYYQRRMLSKGVQYSNPVPNNRVFKFTVYKRDIRNPLLNVELSEKYTDDELIDLLQKSKKKHLRDFILFLLVICCGMRPSELFTIETKYIDLEKRVLLTGFENGARKSSKHYNSAIMFFFPKKIVPVLKFFIESNPRKWLFEGYNTYLTGIAPHIERNYGSKYCSLKRFRKTMISRLDDHPHMQTHIREVLMNHVPTTTQGEAYIKKDIDIKRRDYDRFFPYYYILDQIL